MKEKSKHVDVLRDGWRCAEIHGGGKMSVLIKGMKKPNHCMSCPMCNGDDDCILQDFKDFGTWEDQMKACPLVELPERRGTEGGKNVFSI